MSSKFRYITTALIFILLALLLGIFIGYLSTRTLDITTHLSHKSGDKSNILSGEEETGSGNIEQPDDINSVLTSRKHKDSEPITEEPKVEISEPNIEKIKEEPTVFETPLPDGIINASTPKTDETKEQDKEQDSVIVSDVETSNEEKRQVLNELDSTLQGLLEAVGKVPTVDEEKLEASLIESEVAPWKE